MKIAYYADCDLESNDGPAVNESEFLLQLAKNLQGSFFFITLTSNKEFCKKHNISAVYYFEQFKFLSIMQKLRYLRLAIRISGLPFDIMVCRFTSIPLLPFLVKLLNKRKKIAIKTAALWYVDDLSTQTLLDKIFIKIRDMLYKYLYKTADVIDTALPYAKVDIEKKMNIPSKNIFLIENGINTNKFSLNFHYSIEEVRNCFPVLGFMGSLPSSRGAHQILEVSERIIKKYPRLGVIILGYDDSLQYIIDRLTKLGVRVVAPGKVPYLTIEKYVQSMTIGFSFYENTASKHGNASQKVRQYLSCGKPVFSIYHNHQFLVDNNLGMIFESTDYDKMAKGVIEWTEKIEKNSHDIEVFLRNYALQHFSIESTFRTRLQIYEKIIANK